MKKVVFVVLVLLVMLVMVLPVFANDGDGACPSEGPERQAGWRVVDIEGDDPVDRNGNNHICRAVVQGVGTDLEIFIDDVFPAP